MRANVAPVTSIECASARASATAAPICARWVRPCGKFPSSSPVRGSTSSENRPRSLPARQRSVVHGSGVVELALPGEALGEPERTAEERSLRARQPVVTPVAIQQPVARIELLADRRRRSQHPLVAPVDELDGRQQQQRRVQLRAGRTPGRTRRACGRSHGARLSRRSSIANLLPAAHRGAPHALIGEPDPAVERGPAQHLRVHEVVGLAGPFPDAAVGLHAALAPRDRSATRGSASRRPSGEWPRRCQRHVRLTSSPYASSWRWACGVVADVRAGREPP